MPFQNPDYVSVWDQIDQTLVRLKLQEPSEKHVEDVAEERSKIEFEYKEKRQAMVAALLKMVERRADEWLGVEYRVHCDVWKLQGHSITADFLRSLRDNIVAPTVSARTIAERSHLIMMWERCGYPGRQILETRLTKFKFAMMRLEHRWKTRLEIAARELEYAGDQAGKIKELQPSELSSSTQVQQRPSARRRRKGRIVRRKIRRILNAGNRRKAALKYRSDLKRAILLCLTQRPDSTDLDICRWIDDVGACDLPNKWKQDKTQRSFESVYMNPTFRSRIQVIISKIRSGMRKHGLL